MKVTVVLKADAQLALTERVELLRTAADVRDVLLTNSARHALGSLDRGSVPYLFDVNRITTEVGIALRLQRRPYILDTGDDLGQLMRTTRGGLAAVAGARMEQSLISAAAAVVCRGSFHQPILRAKTGAPLHWAPDTVSDELLDRPYTPFDDGAVASFGSCPRPTSSDRAYGWEVIDLVARVPGLTGILVLRGPGAAALQARARRMGVSGRVSIEAPLPLEHLASRLEAVAFVTSIQSDDVAGWVRTTGKLPVALALGKGLVTTRVGEASRILPDRFLISPGRDNDVVDQMAGVVASGLPPDWPLRAKGLAERFRRTRVAADLRSFLSSVGG